MTFNSDVKKILSIFHTIRLELNETARLPKILTLDEAKDQLTVREVQLNTVIEISEKLISQLTSPQAHIREDHNDISELKVKYHSLQKLYDFALENLDSCKFEIKNLQTELHSLAKSPSENNLFTVEVYQSEIEDLKKDYKKKIEELKSNS